MLTISRLKKSFGAVHAVDDISFDIRRGEVIGLLGPNGAGKTTTMRLVTGFLKPDTGTLKLEEIDILEQPQEARRHIGYLPENAPSYHEMEVTEFLVYAARLRALSKEEEQKGLKEIIALCGLGEVIGRPIGQLSRGYKQRVCLAQAMIHRPKLLILDEPTTGLDPHQIQEIRTLIKQIGQERTVILSTHIMQEVQAVCSRALIIAGGKLAGEGTLDELLAQGKGKGRYFARIRAPRDAIEKKMEDLKGLRLETFQPGSNGLWQSIVMESEDQADRSEAIFNWVVQNNWSLSELKSERTSLEDVFLELTKK